MQESCQRRLAYPWVPVNRYIYVYTRLPEFETILARVGLANPNLKRGNNMATKKVNYTPEQTRALVADYQACETQDAREDCVEQFAILYGKSAQSIRAKLTSEGVYVAKAYKTKKGEKPESKAAIVASIAAILGCPEETVESLEKANKAALTLIRGTLAAAHAALGREN